ncbi:zinc ribbon domain-containing protein [Nocardia sp. NPDC059091]|uniref:double zinc ribbon domain-containing protein n=1 Tax=Nocardia sp. NPDC059091 TaxID=3346724 RepID=UPI00367E8B03
MTGPVVFTSYYHDESNDDGFQWEFRCDRCSTAYKSPFEQNYFSRGRGALRVLRDLFGDQVRAIDKISNAAESYSNHWGGSSSSTKDKAFARAVEQVRSDFRLCGGCGRWVCHRVCWNEQVGQCTNCSPQVAHQIAQAQAEARGSQIREAAYQQDWASQHDVATPARVSCPTCGAHTTGGKFCSTCGSALSLQSNCRGCGHQVQVGAAFCANCGQPQ